jgi:hypothetical protein
VWCIYFRSKRIVFFSLFLVFFFLFDSSYSLASTAQEKAAADLKREGVELYHSGAYVQAIENFKQIESKTTDKFILAQAYIYLSMSYYCLEEKEESIKWLNKAMETNPEINEGDLLFPPGFESLYAKAKEEAAKSAQRPAPTSIVKKPVVKVSFGTGEKKKKKSPLLFIVGGLAVAGALAYVLLAKKKTPPPTTGSIQVNSTPTGAKVYLDGSDSGKTTNCTLADVSAGSHAIKLVKDGYVDYSGSAAVTAGQTATVDVTLTPNTITVIKPTASAVWVKGEKGEIQWQVSATTAGQAQTIISSQMGQTALMRQRLLAQHLGASQVRRDAGERLSDSRTAARSVRPDVSRESAGNLINRDSALVQSKAQGPAGARSSPGLTLPQSRPDSMKGGLAAGSFSATDSLDIAKVGIDLYKGSALIPPPIATEIGSNTGALLWMVPENLDDGNDYKVRISCTTDSSVFKDSEAFTICGPAVLSVTPADGLTSAGVAGGPFSTPSKDYALKNEGGTLLKWKAAKTQTWMTLSASSGSLPAGASATVTVSINSNANSLGEGTHSDTVTFTNETNGNGNTTRPVSLTVTAGPVLSVTPTYRNVASTPGTTTFAVSNIGGGTMNWDAAVTDGRDWLTIQSGLNGTNSGTITAAFTANPEATPRTGKIRVGALASGSPVKVTVTQAGAPVLSVTPADGFTSSGAGGNFNPVSKTYTLQNGGLTSLAWTAAKAQTWTTLSPSPPSGTLAAGASATVTVSINSNANSLAAGSYGDTVTFQNVTNGNGNTTRPVSLTVTGGGLPDLIVYSLTGSIGATGASFTVVVKNNGIGAAGASKLRMTLKSKLTTWKAEMLFDVPALASGVTHSLTYKIIATVPVGTYRLYAYADASFIISESNESNNEKYIDVNR